VFIKTHYTVQSPSPEGDSRSINHENLRLL